MISMENFTRPMMNFLSSFQSLALLAVRLVLAYGFYEPAMNKLKGFGDIVIWFEHSLHLPFPWLNAVMATGVEVAGVILLTLGLFTRLISIPMSVVMMVAIATVHWTHGFSAAHNGFEIPLYYMVMLLVLITTGPGKFSLDETIMKKYCSHDYQSS